LTKYYLVFEKAYLNQQRKHGKEKRDKKQTTSKKQPQKRL